LSKPGRPTASALTIAGSDSGGGAGIQADLKTFAALGVHGTSVLTCVTAQNPESVTAVQPCSLFVLRHQLEAVFSELPPAAVKTGMLYSSRIIETVARFIKTRRVPLVVDPVMISTSGKRLLSTTGLRKLCSLLLPIATLVTPNLFEAEALLNQQLRTPEDLRAAARKLHQRFGCATLVKGGHLQSLNQAVDIFYDGKDELLLSAPLIKGVRTHGTGCTYSAAITAYLARGLSMSKAVCQAKEFITQAIVHRQTVSGHPVLNSLWRRA